MQHQDVTGDPSDTGYITREPEPSQPLASVGEHKPAEAPVEIYLHQDASPRDLTAKALDALAVANERSPRLFQRDRSLVRVLPGPRGATTVESLDVDRLRFELERICDFYKLVGRKGKTNESVYVPVHPPLELVRNVLASDGWPLPELVAVSRVPIVREDGSIATDPGYDPASGLWYAPAGNCSLQLRLADHPGRQAVQQAVSVLMDCLADFPFDCDASRANALALLFTMILRPRIAGCVPLAIVESPTPGSGKGLLLRVLWVIATGEPPSPETLPENEEELRKRITALLARGDSLVLFDNVSHFVTSDVLCSVLTNDSWSDRVLGQTKRITVPQHATWALNGNNVQVGRDMLRRVYRSRIDAGLEHPERRADFRHPDLEQFVVDYRAELLGAALTIWRGWNQAGRPRATSRPIMGGFQSWANLMADLLEFAGVPGFLANRVRDDEANDEALEWTALFAAWHSRYGDRPMLLAELVVELQDGSSTLRSTLPTIFIESLSRGDLARRLGNALKRQVGIPRGEAGLRLARSEFSNDHRVRWRVLTADQAASVTPASTSEANTEPAFLGVQPDSKRTVVAAKRDLPTQDLSHNLLACLPETSREVSVAQRAAGAYAHAGCPPVSFDVPGELPVRCAGRVLFQRLDVLIRSGVSERVEYAYSVLRRLADDFGDTLGQPGGAPNTREAADHAS